MTTYNTGNDIGSIDPRDLLDNAQNLDESLLTENPTFQDRLGRTRVSWEGAIKYSVLSETYSAGIEVTTRNQIIFSDGEWWAISGSISLPYTTTGSGMPEGGAFQSAGDAKLRSDLLLPNGSVNVGVGQRNLFDVLSDSYSIEQLESDVGSLSLNETQMRVLFENGESISAYSGKTIQLPSGRFNFTGSEIMTVGPNSGNVTIKGYPPITTELTSIAAVTGSVGAWDVEINLISSAGFEVGDYVCIRDVRPGRPLGLSDDPVAILNNELAVGFYRLGEVSVSSSSAIVTFSGSIASTYLAIGDLIHVQGMTRIISSIDGPSQITVNSPFDKDVVGFQWWYYSTPDTSTAVTVGGSGDVVNFANSITPARANIDDIIIVNGQIRKITEIVSANQVRVNSDIDIPSGSKFTIVAGGVSHEGAHEITAISGNKITVRNKNKYLMPPKNRIDSGSVSCLKTVLKSDGDGLIFQQSSSISIGSVAIIGNESPISVGLKLNGSSDRAYSQANGVVTVVDDFVAVCGFGTGVTTSGGSTFNGYGVFVSGNVNDGVNLNDGANAYLRNAVISGNGLRGVFVGAGCFCRGSTIKLTGNAAQGVRLDVGGSFYGDQPLSWGNASHGVMAVNRCGFQFVDGYSMCNGSNGLNLQNTGGGRWSRTLTSANENHNIQVITGDLECTQIWASGPGAGRSNLVASKSTVDASDSALNGSSAQGVYAFDGGRVDLSGSNVQSNSTGVRSDGVGSLIRSVTAIVDNNTSNRISVDGGIVLSADNINGTHKSGSHYSDSLVIADDSSVSFYTGSATIMLSVVSASSNSLQGLIRLRSDSSNNSAIVVATGIVVSTGILTGTTGIDGDFTISAGGDGMVYIENRTGSSKTISYSAMGNIT